MKWKLLALIVVTVLFSAPVFAQSLLLATDCYGTMPSDVIPIASTTQISLWASLVWPGHEGTDFSPARISFDYDIWGTGNPGDFLVMQIENPHQAQTVGSWFPWADVATNQPIGTFIDVQAGLRLTNTSPILFSNTLTFEITDGTTGGSGVVPEPSSLIVLLSSITGLGGLVLRRRR